MTVASPSSTRWRSYVALILGFFLVILVANWIGLLPGVGTKDDIAGSAHELAAIIPGSEVLDIPGRDHMRAVGDKVYKDGVLVMQSPDMWFMRDTDGDGTADKMTVFAEGFNTPVTGIAAAIP